MLSFILMVFTQGMQWCHSLCHWHDVTLTLASMAPYDQNKWCWTLFQSPGHKEWNGTINNAISIMMQVKWNRIFFIMWQYWQQHHVMMPVVSHDKNNIALPFNYLDLRNAMISLLILLAPSDAKAGSSGITWPKHVRPHCDHLDIGNAMIPLTMPLASLWCQEPYTETCLDTFIIGLENGLERKKIICIIYDVLRRFVSVLYRTCISTLMVTLRCEEFSYWLTQIVNNSGMGCL